MKLLVHHHAIAYKDSDGIWIHSTMGSWITHLADHFEEVGLLLHVTEDKKPVQDTCIINKNVVLHSLGPPGRMWDKVQRTLRIRKACAELDNKYDTLLIRGITPRQHIIWNNVKVTTCKKYLLLVGSLLNNITIINIRSLSDFYNYYMERYRRYELKNMLKNGELLVNSFVTQKEAVNILNIRSSFVPTNTISEKEFTSFNIKNIRNPLSLLFCGRIEIKKGIIEGISAVNILKKEGIDVQLDIVGPVEDQKFIKEAKVMIDELNINDRVTFHGMIPYGYKLFSFYKNADIFVIPSYTEGFPRVIWEAAANCCPVIATKVGGIPSLFKHREHGILIPPQNKYALADSIIKLINNTTLRSDIVTNAYKLANEYTVEKCTNRLSEIILKDTTNDGI